MNRPDRLAALLPRSGVILVGTLALALVLLARFYVGFQASDDASYLTGALGWVEQFPYVGQDHWTLRHTITIPTALFLRWFGTNEFATSLSNILYFLAFLAVNAWFANRYLGRGSGLVSTLLFITMPGFVVVATYLNPDITELFFASCALWVVRAAIEQDDRSWLWGAAGGLTGLAFLTRQTSAALILFFALLFVARPLVPRVRYLWLGIAAFAVIGAEWLYLTTMTGDPLHRLTVDFHHGVVDRAAEVERVAKLGAWVDQEGNISVNVFLNPIINLFLSQKYALLYWFLLPAAFFAWKVRSERVGLTLGLIGGFALLSFVFIAVNPKLYFVPRYLVIAAWGACLFVAWWFAALWRGGRRGLALGFLAIALAANAGTLAIENINPRFVERALVDWVAKHPGEKIYTDIETRERAIYYFRFAGQPMDAVIAAAPPAGASFFYSKERAMKCASMARCRDHADAFRPRSGWRVRQVIEGPQRPIAGLVSALALERVLPPDVMQRLLAPVGQVTVYSVQ